MRVVLSFSNSIPAINLISNNSNIDCPDKYIEIMTQNYLLQFFIFSFILLLSFITAVHSQSTPIPKYPCISSSTDGVCLFCAYPYTLVDSTCKDLSKQPCSASQFRSPSGICLSLPANCFSVDSNGQCRVCQDGYTMVSNINGINSCLPSNFYSNGGSCAYGAYWNGNSCVGLPLHCLNFDSNVMVCANCEQGFISQGSICAVDTSLMPNTAQQPSTNASSTLMTTPTIPPSYNQGNNNAQNFQPPQLPQNSPNPTFLPTFDPLNCIYPPAQFTKCLLCAVGYALLDGRCFLVVCPDRYFTKNGICQRIGEGCQDYDNLWGICSNCKQGYSFVNGQCTVNIKNQNTGNSPSQTQSQPQSYQPQSQSYYIPPPPPSNITGTPIQPQSTIPIGPPQSYSVDKCPLNVYIIYLGYCTSLDSVCSPMKYYNSNENRCIPVSPGCLRFNISTGVCYLCSSDLKLMNDSTCRQLPICSANQFRQADGNCGTISELCIGSNQANGWCLACPPTYELNQGVCCYKYNYLLDKACVRFLASNCSQVRETFGNCMQCNDGFNLAHGVFGKCFSNAIKNP